MDKRIALTDEIYLDGVDLSNSIRAIGFTSEDEQVDVSGFNDSGNSEFLAGVRVTTIEMDVFITSGSGELRQILYPLHKNKTEFDITWKVYGGVSVSATNPILRGTVSLPTWSEGGTRGEVETATLTFIAPDASAVPEFYYT